MDFNKYHHPANFRFLKRHPGEAAADSSDTMRYVAAGCEVTIRVESLKEDVFRLTASAERWSHQHSQAELEFDFDTPGAARFELGAGGEFRILDGDGAELLRSAAGQAFGVCGTAWLLAFEPEAEMRFYGMGEKSLPFERSGLRTKFWNTDVWADFAQAVYRDGRPDPMYISIPYLIIKRGNRYLGILVNSAEAVFMSTSYKTSVYGRPNAHSLEWI